MNKILKLVPALLSILLFTSCLKSGLDDLPAFEDAEITSFKFEYRWVVKNVDNDQLSVQTLDVTNTIDTENNVVDCTITVPAASDDFPTEVRDLVTESNIVGYCNISTAASLKPIGNAPKLGIIQDFSGSSFQYEVTAADGKTKKVWTINIVDFIK